MVKILLVVVFGLLLATAMAGPLAKEPAGVYGDHFEGDMVLTEDQLDAILSPPRTGQIAEFYRWPNKTVPYQFSPVHTAEQNKIIENALNEIEAVSCVKFVPHTNEKAYVQIINGTSCYAGIGYNGGKQNVSLSTNGCIQTGIIQHEFIHILGFYHMQSASDRDNYVTIHWDNIDPKQHFNFMKYADYLVSHFGGTYDYDSIMHYRANAFTKNGMSTMTPKDESKLLTMGLRQKMSQQDIMKLNNMYKC